MQKTDDDPRVVYERFTTGTVGLTDPLVDWFQNDNGTRTTVQTISATENPNCFNSHLQECKLLTSI